MPISDYSTTRDSNASIAPGDLRSNDYRRDQQIINAIRQLMADLASFVGGGGGSSFVVPINFISAAGVRYVQIANDSNGAIEIGKVDGNTSTPLIDFHTSATPTDYNVRLIASGTSSTNGSGQLDIHADAGVVLINGRLQFPASQNPSTNANVLDDYEEGTWTPGISFSGGTTGITYNIQAGSYVKVGQLVFYQGRVILTSNGTSTGNLWVTGLPFTAASTSHGYVPGSVGYYSSFSGLTGSLKSYVEVSNTYLNIVQSGATSIGFVNDGNTTDTTDIIFAGTYRASA